MKMKLLEADSAHASTSMGWADNLLITSFLRSWCRNGKELNFGKIFNFLQIFILKGCISTTGKAIRTCYMPKEAQ
jgi:hypothetical protein